ncbi:MAG: lipase family alpha/beta hydrolase [Thermoplasmata archaeon]
MHITKALIIGMVTAILIGLTFSSASFADQNGQTFVILVNGYTVSGNGYWMMGVNIYQQLVNAGYTVGIMSYYGPFSINFSNGYQYIYSNFNGTNNTPIEVIAAQFAEALINLSYMYGNVTVDIVAHSMGGLITMYMMENYILPVNINSVITIGTPFEGSNLAWVSYYLGKIGLQSYKNSGYQDVELMPNSTFIKTLNEYQSNVTSNYPNTVIIAYAGNYDPWWGYVAFPFQQNDGLVSDPSALGFYHNYQYVFPDLHSPDWDKYTFGGVSYFEDQNVANTILNNLSGNY